MRQPNGRVPQGMRKVRAPQGRVPANGWWRRLQGECNREIPPGFPARVERCGKSAPAAWQLVRHVNPTRCKIEGGAWGGPPRSRYRISSLATGCVDRWPFTTELGLQAALIYIGKPAFGPVFSYKQEARRTDFPRAACVSGVLCQLQPQGFYLKGMEGEVNLVGAVQRC